MIIAVDFDGTIVSQDHAFDDLTTPLEFLPGAKEGLLALKAAGHILLLYSARANRARLYNPEFDPLVRAGVVRVPPEPYLTRARELAADRWRQMLRFVEAELPGVFDAIDDGAQGKPSADLFVDDRALQFGQGALQVGWPALAARYGAAPEADGLVA